MGVGADEMVVAAREKMQKISKDANVTVPSLQKVPGNGTETQKAVSGKVSVQTGRLVQKNFHPRVNVHVDLAWIRVLRRLLRCSSDPGCIQRFLMHASCNASVVFKPFPCLICGTCANIGSSVVFQ